MNYSCDVIISMLKCGSNFKKSIVQMICNYSSKTVLWKRLNPETSQRGNASKTGFEEFPFFLGNTSKLENVEGFPNIFEAFPNI